MQFQALAPGFMKRRGKSTSNKSGSTDIELQNPDLFLIRELPSLTPLEMFCTGLSRDQLCECL